MTSPESLEAILIKAFEAEAAAYEAEEAAASNCLDTFRAYSAANKALGVARERLMAATHSTDAARRAVRAAARRHGARGS